MVTATRSLCLLFGIWSLSISHVLSFMCPHRAGDSVFPVAPLAKNKENESNDVAGEDKDDTDTDDLSLEAFQLAKKQQQQPNPLVEEEFDGYALRDVVLQKWGHCYDLEFSRIDSFGNRNVYLNVLPFQLGRRPFRHETEYDYLCHLQAIVEILEKYKQLDYVLYQIQETNKRPRPGTSPLVAVPLRLELSPEEVDAIIG